MNILIHITVSVYSPDMCLRYPFAYSSFHPTPLFFVSVISISLNPFVCQDDVLGYKLSNFIHTFYLRSVFAKVQKHICDHQILSEILWKKNFLRYSSF